MDARQQQTGATTAPHLAKVMDLRQLFSMAFGMIIGVGWITVLSFWLGEAGSFGAILAFAVGWAFMLTVVLCYAEIAAMFPVSGGEVAYAYKIYGLRVSYFAGWCLALQYISVTAFEAISVGWVLDALVPGVDGPVVYSILGEDIHLTPLVVGLGGMGVIAYVNYLGASLSARLQETMIIGLLLAAAAFTTGGLIAGEPENLKPYFAGVGEAGFAWSGFLAVLATTPFWFAGFDIIPQALGERSSSVNLGKLPIVIVAAITLSLAFYVLVILAAAMSMPRADLLDADLPTAAAISNALNSELGGRLVLFGGLLGLISTWNAIFFGATRLIFALARARMISPALSRVHSKNATPYASIFFVATTGGILTLLGRQAIVPIVNIGSFILAFLFCIISWGVIILRRRAPAAARPYRVPGGPVIPVIATLFAGAMSVVAFIQPYFATDGAPMEWWIIAGWLLLGAALWRHARDVRKSVTEAEREKLILED